MGYNAPVRSFSCFGGTDSRGIDAGTPPDAWQDFMLISNFTIKELFKITVRAKLNFKAKYYT